MTDEPSLQPRRSAGRPIPTLSLATEPALEVYFSSIMDGHVCFMPELEPQGLTVPGEQSPLIDVSVQRKLANHNLSHLEHRMKLVAARPIPVDAAFVHQQGRQKLALFEVRSRDRRLGRPWCVFFFVDFRARRRIVHCVVRPMAPTGGQRQECSVARPFRAANEVWAPALDRDIRHAWGMCMTYEPVECEAPPPERPDSVAERGGDDASSPDICSEKQNTGCVPAEMTECSSSAVFLPMSISWPAADCGACTPFTIVSLEPGTIGASWRRAEYTPDVEMIFQLQVLRTFSHARTLRMGHPGDLAVLLLGYPTVPVATLLMAPDLSVSWLRNCSPALAARTLAAGRMNFAGHQGSCGNLAPWSLVGRAAMIEHGAQHSLDQHEVQ